MTVNLTTNYQFRLPVPGTEIDVWRALLNANWTDIDTDLKTITDGAKLFTQEFSRVTGGYWLWNTSTVISDPGTGNILGNAAGFATITVFAISTTRSDGGSAPSLSFNVGDFIQFRTSASRFVRYYVTAIVNNGTWMQLTVVLISGAGTPVSLEQVNIANFGPYFNQNIPASTVQGNNTGAVGPVLNLTAAQTNTLLGTLPVGQLLPSRNQSTSSTLLLTDVGKIVQTTGSGTTQTVDTTAITLWPSNSVLYIVNAAATATILAPAAGVTFRAANGLSIPQFGMATLYKIGAADSWYVVISSQPSTGPVEFDMGAYTNSAQKTQAHGLGALPSNVQVFLQCTTIQVGYAVGDRIRLPNGDNTANLLTVMFNATNVILSTGTAPNIMSNAATPVSTALIPGSWKVIFKVYP